MVRQQVADKNIFNIYKWTFGQNIRGKLFFSLIVVVIYLVVANPQLIT